MNQQRTVVMVGVWAQIASFNFPNALILAPASTAYGSHFRVLQIAFDARWAGTTRMREML
jgi:hypothetical protein